MKTYDDLLKWASKQGWGLLVEEWEGHYWLAVTAGPPEHIAWFFGRPLVAYRQATLEEAVSVIARIIEEETG